MKLWWLTNFELVGKEKSAVERLAQEGWFTLSGWRVNKHRLSADGIIIANGIPYPVRLLYPDQFPSVPAWVEPQDPKARWSRHQYGEGGPLCLELRPDNWIPTASGVDVLRSAYNLLRTENPLGEGEHGIVESGHRIGDIQSYDWGKEPVLIGVRCLERIRRGDAEGVRALRWVTEDDVWPILVFDAVDRAQPQHPPSFDFGSLRIELPVVVARAEVPESTPADRAGLGSALGVTFDEQSTGAVVVIAVGAERVVPYHCTDPSSVFARKLVVIGDDFGVRSGRAVDKSDRRVAVVGLGSVGSKLAEILIRSGIHNLLLIDGDVFLPGNLERHTLDWRDVGFRKANAVKRRLLHIVPGASVEVIPANLNWQRSAKTHSEQIARLADCDLIVDATGDAPSSLMLGAIAAENAKPFVSAEVFEGGLGCLIARSLPERDPPYVLGRSAYQAYCEQRNVTPPSSGRHRYEALSETGEPVVADDSAVTMAASHLARVALDILDRRVGEADNAWLLIGFRAEWLFERHGHTISLNVGQATPPSVNADDPAAREFAVALAQEALRAAASAE